MLRVAHGNLIVASTALAGLMSAAFLSTTGPAAAADASYCHAQFRSCQQRFSYRTCDRQYDSCMAYAVSSPSTTVFVLGFPRHHRHKDQPKAEPKIPPKPGPIGNPVPKAPTTGTNVPTKGPGGVVVVPGGWPSGGGKSGGGPVGGGGGGKPPIKAN